MLEYIRRSAESWGVKVLFGLIIIVFVFWGVGSYQGNKTQVVAKVNDTSILAQDFSRVVEMEIQNIYTRNPGISSEDVDAAQVRRQVLNSMINNQLLRDEAKRLHISASAEEIAAQIRSFQGFYNEQGQFDTGRYRAILAQQGLTPAAYENEVRMGIIGEKMRHFATLPANVEDKDVKELFDYSSEQRRIQYLLVSAEAFKDAVQPTEKQITDYYEEHKEDYKLPERLKVAYFEFTPEALAHKVNVSDSEILAVYNANKSSYMEEPQVKARHILLMVPDNATPEKEAEIKAQIDDLAEQARKGADFAKLATQFSDDLTKDEGGDLGWVSRGEMVESFEQALFSTDPGNVSEPVRTPYGWHVIKVEERKEAQQSPLEDVREEIRASLQQDKAADTLTDLLDSALEQVISGVNMQDIAKDLNIELQKTELVSQQEAKQEMNLEDSALQTLFKLPQGIVTDTPLATDTGYILAEVLERKPAEIQPLEVVSEEVQKAVSSQLAMQKAKEKAEELDAVISSDGLPEEDRKKLKQSEPFGRQGFFRNLGMNPALATAAFSTPKGQWLDKPFSTAEGYLLAKVSEIIPPSQEQWQQSKDRLIQMLKEGRKDELFMAYIDNLRSKAEIEIVNPQLLQ